MLELRRSMFTISWEDTYSHSAWLYRKCFMADANHKTAIQTLKTNNNNELCSCLNIRGKNTMAMEAWVFLVGRLQENQLTAYQWIVHLRNGKPEMLFWTMSAQCYFDNHSSIASNIYLSWFSFTGNNRTWCLTGWKINKHKILTPQKFQH